MEKCCIINHRHHPHRIIVVIDLNQIFFSISHRRILFLCGCLSGVRRNIYAFTATAEELSTTREADEN